MSERRPAIVDGSLVQRIQPRFSREVDEDMRELVNASSDFDPRGAPELMGTGPEGDDREHRPLAGLTGLPPPVHPLTTQAPWSQVHAERWTNTCLFIPRDRS